MSGMLKLGEIMRAKVAYEILGKFKRTIQYSWLSFLLDAIRLLPPQAALALIISPYFNIPDIKSLKYT